jgi:hypothetical protein
VTDKLTIDPSRAETASSEDGVRIAPDSRLWSFMPRRLPRRVPLFIPRDQAYYWTREWQEGEAEADEEIRRGELRRFSDLDEALRWLDSPED